ncbi:MAG: hypothetical protein RLZZ407_117 [Pseudomonadota bacterium]
MPLPNILSGKTKCCKAKCEARGDQSSNPAAYRMSVCRYHGARKLETIMRGADYPQYRHGQETLQAKAERSLRLAELRELEAVLFAFGLAEGSRWKCRKPRTKHPNHSHHKAELIS